MDGKGHNDDGAHYCPDILCHNAIRRHLIILISDTKKYSFTLTILQNFKWPTEQTVAQSVEKMIAS